MAETKIVLNRQSDLILDNAQITAPVGIVMADIDGLVSSVNSIDTHISTDISSEASARVSGDASLAAGLSTEVAGREAAVSAEESARIAGDNSLEAAASVAMSAEVSSRVAGDASLESNLSSEVSNREAAVSSEASLRVAGDASLAADLSAEGSRAVVAETSLQNNIDAEESARIVGDQAEESRAVAAEGSLATLISTEESRAMDAESSLDVNSPNGSLYNSGQTYSFTIGSESFVGVYVTSSYQGNGSYTNNDKLLQAIAESTSTTPYFSASLTAGGVSITNSDGNLIGTNLTLVSGSIFAQRSSTGCGTQIYLKGVISGSFGKITGTFTPQWSAPADPCNPTAVSVKPRVCPSSNAKQTYF